MRRDTSDRPDDAVGNAVIVIKSNHQERPREKDP